MNSYKTEIKTTEGSDNMNIPKKTKKLKSIFTHSSQKVPTQKQIIQSSENLMNVKDMVQM